MEIKVLKKKDQKEKLEHILETLDERYGTKKEGFYHEQPWQLLAATEVTGPSRPSSR